METRTITLSVLGEQEQRGRIIQVEKALLSRNQHIAEDKRKRFKQAGLLVINRLKSLIPAYGLRISLTVIS